MSQAFSAHAVHPPPASTLHSVSTGHGEAETTRHDAARLEYAVIHNVRSAAHHLDGIVSLSDRRVETK